MFKHRRFSLLSTSAVIAASLLMSAPLVNVAHAFGVGVQPSTVEMTVKPGDRQRQVITLGNVHKEKTISLTLGLADWHLDENGELVLNPPGETERSAADWIRFSPASVTLKPETSQDITVEITTPYKIKQNGDHRFALLATTLLPELDERGEESGVWNRYQLASLFYLTLTPSESLPEITKVAVNDSNKSILSFEIQNDGDAHARLQGKAFFKSDSGDVVAETPLNAVVLDQAKRNYHVDLTPIEGLQSGETYKVDFDLRNSYSPQNKFKSVSVPVPSLEYQAP